MVLPIVKELYGVLCERRNKKKGGSRMKVGRVGFDLRFGKGTESTKTQNRKYRTTKRVVPYLLFCVVVDSASFPNREKTGGR